MHRYRKKDVLCFSRWTRKGYAAFASLHKVVKIGVVTFACSLVQQTYEPVMAQSTDSIAGKKVVLQEVEVSEDQPLPWATTSQLIQVTEQRDIQASPVQSLDNLLESVPGLDVRQRGSDGIQADISIRGGTFDQAVILLNGFNISDPQTGHFSLDLPFTLSDVRRVEILQGSGSRIWGSNAFSGVINVVTTPSFLQPSQKVSAHFGVGSFGRQHASLSLEKANTRWQSSASISAQKSDGYRANTDYTHVSAYVQTAYTDVHAGLFQVQAGYQQKAFGANSFYSLAYPNQFERTKTLFAAFDWKKRLGTALLSAQIGERVHHDRFELFRDFHQAPGWYTGHNYHLNNSTQADLHLLQPGRFGKTTVGMSFRDERILSNVLGTRRKDTLSDPMDKDGAFTREGNRTLYRFYADHSFRWKTLSASAGFSANTQAGYKPFLTGGADAALRFARHYTAGASLSNTYRIPSFTDLYYSSKSQMGNPYLKPERSTTLEASLDYSDGRLKMRGVAYHRWGKDVIDWVKHPSTLTPDTALWHARNETSIQATGVDLTTEYTWGKGLLRKVTVVYSTLSMDKQALGYDSKYALDYLRQKLGVRVEHALWKSARWGSCQAIWSAFWQDRAGTYTDPASGKPHSYPDNWYGDVRLSWEKNRFQVHLDGNNLFNMRSADFGGLAQAGRSAQLSVGVTL
jgi:iron complex outermembrane receptor protein